MHKCKRTFAHLCMFIVEKLENKEKYEEENTIISTPILSDNNQ